MKTITLPKKILSRQREITGDFFKILEKHMHELSSGKVSKMFEIKDVADILHIHPTHLSNTIKLTTGKSPCDIYEEKIMTLAKSMLAQTRMPIADIATLLTFDPSNFTKFFKHLEGITPKQFREASKVTKEA
jgi:AraC-like DNA-binding protein